MYDSVYQLQKLNRNHFKINTYKFLHTNVALILTTCMYARALLDVNKTQLTSCMRRVIMRNYSILLNEMHTVQISEELGIYFEFIEKSQDTSLINVIDRSWINCYI